MASLSKAVYNLGLQNTILDKTKKNFLALTNSNGKLLAYSKIFTGDGNLIGDFTNGQLSIAIINYQDTASVELASGEQATRFAVVSWPAADANMTGNVEAYTGQNFTGPIGLDKEGATVTIIDEDGSEGNEPAESTATALKAWLIGDLLNSNQPTINAASNFLFSGATVTFSEQ